MKKTLYIIFLSFLFLNFSYGQEEVVLIKGDTIHKKINLTFNQEAIKLNEYLIFKINDNFDFKNLTLLVNNKETSTTNFKIYATETNISVPVDFFLKEKASAGNYTFSAKLIETSTKLKNNVEYKGKKEFKPIILVKEKTSNEKLIQYLIYGVVGLLSLLIFYFIYLKSKEFKKGIIQLTHPYNEEFYLNRYKRKFKFKDVVNEDMGLDFYLTKGSNGRAKIYAFGTAMIEVNGEVKSNGYLLFLDDEVKISNDNNKIVFIYN